jgi:hypothetical protein
MISGMVMKTTLEASYGSLVFAGAQANRFKGLVFLSRGQLGARYQSS